MTPYYDDGQCVIYHGDCRDVVPALTFDVAVTDPPYGMGHYETDVAALPPALLRTLIDNGTTAVFGYPERMVALCVVAGVVPDEWITWWPTNASIKAYNNAGLLNEAEVIAVFGEHDMAGLRQPRTASSRRLIAKNYDIGAKGRGDTHGDPDSRRCGDVWTDAAPNLAFQSDKRLHPNEKPIGVMRRLVEGVGGDVVLDPFAGSGATLRAAKDLGRRAIGVEIEERYCEIAANRLAQGVLDFGGAA